MPDATNTGVPAGVALTAVQGDVDLRTAGQVYNGMDVRGCISVNAANVTIRNSRIRCNGDWGVRSNSTGLLIQDVEIDNLNGDGTGVGGGNFTARRVNAHGGANGFSADNNVTIASSYIHDLWHGVDNHTDGIQISSGSVGLVIDHNTIFNNDENGTSAIIGGDGTTVTVSNNLLGGGGYALYCAPGSAGFKAVNNTFSRIIWPNGGFYGPWDNCNGIGQRTGNVWDDTGQAVG